DFQIKHNEILLICRRSAIIELRDIFHNNNSSLNNQIIKSLLYYYGLTSSLCRIASIIVKRFGSKNVLDKKSLENEDIQQIFITNKTLAYKINHTQLDIILDETTKSHSLRNSLSHYFTGYVKDKSYEKFEKYWKSFNAIYKSITGIQQDKGALINLRAFSVARSNNMFFSNE